MFFCDYCRIHCRKLNMIISICHGVTAVLMKAKIRDCVDPNIFKTIFSTLLWMTWLPFFGCKCSNTSLARCAFIPETEVCSQCLENLGYPTVQNAAKPWACEIFTLNWNSKKELHQDESKNLQRLFKASHPLATLARVLFLLGVLLHFPDWNGRSNCLPVAVASVCGTDPGITQAFMAFVA